MNQISSLMQTVKGLLPPQKAAWQLHILSGQSLSLCQKILSGHRSENLEMVVALLRSDLGWEVLRELIGDEQPDWFADLNDLSDITALKRDQLRMQRDIAKREQRHLERGAGR